MGPEINSAATVVAASNSSATRSGISWLTSPVFFAGVRATVAGMVTVVMWLLSSVMKFAGQPAG
jgi:hypothetical protein